MKNRTGAVKKSGDPNAIRGLTAPALPMTENSYFLSVLL